MRHLLFCAIACCLSFGIAGPLAAQDRPAIVVQGVGEVAAAPDMATVSLGALAQSDTAADAMNEVSAAVAAILTRLESFEIAPADVQTSSVSLNPVWDRSSSTRTPRITGYQASNTVTVRVRALDDLGAVLNAVLQDGANQFNGLSFGLADPEPALNAARRAAVANARAKAELYADAAGITLGPLRQLSEAGGSMPRPEMMSARMADESVPIAPGEVTYRAQVSMVYDIASD